MTTNAPGEQLSSKRYVTVPIRLLVDEAGGLIQGEIVDFQGHPQRHFMGWQGLNLALRETLAKLRTSSCASGDLPRTAE